MLEEEVRNLREKLKNKDEGREEDSRTMAAINEGISVLEKQIS